MQSDKFNMQINRLKKNLKGGQEEVEVILIQVNQRSCCDMGCESIEDST